jgi:hypothetical protein
VARVRASPLKLAVVDVKIDDEEIVLQVLGGLPPSFSHLATALEIQPFLTLESCISSLPHYEEPNGGKDNKASDADAAFFTKNHGG